MISPCLSPFEASQLRGQSLAEAVTQPRRIAAISLAQRWEHPADWRIFGSDVDAFHLWILDWFCGFVDSFWVPFGIFQGLEEVTFFDRPWQFRCVLGEQLVDNFLRTLLPGTYQPLNLGG